MEVDLHLARCLSIADFICSKSLIITQKKKQKQKQKQKRQKKKTNKFVFRLNKSFWDKLFTTTNIYVLFIYFFFSDWK